MASKNEEYILAAHGEFLGKMIETVRLASGVEAEIQKMLGRGARGDDATITRLRERVLYYAEMAEMYGKACETITSFQKMR